MEIYGYAYKDKHGNMNYILLTQTDTRKMITFINCTQMKKEKLFCLNKQISDIKYFINECFQKA